MTDSDFKVMTAEAALTLAQGDGGSIWFAGRVKDGLMWPLARAAQMTKDNGIITVSFGDVGEDRMRAKTEIYVQRHRDGQGAAA